MCNFAAHSINHVISTGNNISTCHRIISGHYNKLIKFISIGRGDGENHLVANVGCGWSNYATIVTGIDGDGVVDSLEGYNHIDSAIGHDE